MARIYEEQAKAKLPLSEQEFREVIGAEFMVFGRRGIGGPQVAEVQRMLTDGGSGADADAAWRLSQINGFTQSQACSKNRFLALRA